MSTSLIIDIALVAIVAACVIHGFYRGVLLAMGGLAGTVAGFIGAKKLGGLLTPILSTLITPPLRGVVEGVAEAQGLATAGQEGAAQVNETLTQLMEALGLDGQVMASVEAQVQGVGERIIDAVTTGLVDTVAPALAFILLFLVIRGVVTLVLHLLGRMRIPVLSTVDRVLGGVTGLVSGVIIAGLVALALSILLPEYTSGIVRLVESVGDRLPI